MNFTEMIESQRNVKNSDNNDDNNSFKSRTRESKQRSSDSTKNNSHRRRSKSDRERSVSIDKKLSSHRRRSRSNERRSSKNTSRSDRRSTSTKRYKNRSDRHKSRSSSRSYREKHTSRNMHRRNQRDNSPRRSRSNSRSKCYAADVKEIQKKFTDDEKDARTVYVWQLSQRVRTRDLEDLFSSIGKLCVVRLILDPRSGKSKGVAYIQFRNTESVDKALGLNGTKLMGFPIMLRTVSSEKCRAAEASMVGGGLNMKGPTQLCISNLHPIITERNLDEIFGPYGTISDIRLLKDMNGKSSGTAFITYLRGENAKVAMDQLNEFLLAQMPIKITPVTESNFGNELNESQGVSMTSSARLGLMAKLAVGTGLQMTPSINIEENSVISTQCIVLSNMFDVKEVDDEECLEIEEDIVNECSKFGSILHIYVDKKRPSGNVYMKCQNVLMASQCVNSIHGRSFDGRTITANYIPLSVYVDMFPDHGTSKKF